MGDATVLVLPGAAVVAFLGALLAAAGPPGAAAASMGAAPPSTVSQAGMPVAAQPDEGISGRVVTGAGRPEADTFIAVSSAGATSGPIPDIAIFSNAEGRFFWPLRPGTYRLRATRDGRTVGSATVEVRSGRTTAVEIRTTP